MNSKFNLLYSKLSTLKNQKIFLALTISISLILIYIMNYLYPLMIDDWQYSFVFWEYPLKHVETIDDIITSQYNHYIHWGGRTIVHTIAQILLMIDPLWQDILNTVVLVSLFCIIYRICNFNNPTKVRVFILILIMFNFLQPSFAATMLWLTGSANYLWGCLIIILYIYPHYTYYRTEKTNKNMFLPVLFFLFAIVAGWTNENMSIALIFFVSAEIYLLKQEKRKIPLWMSLGLVGLIIGSSFMIMAPGNHARYVYESTQQGLNPEESMISIKAIISRIPKMAFLYLKRLLWLSVPYLILLKYYKKQQSDAPKEKRKIIQSSLLFFASANIAFFVLIATPGFADRAFFGIVTLFIIAISILYANLNFKTALSRKINLTILSIAIIAMLFDYSNKYKTIHIIHDVLKERELIVIEGKKKGKTDFVFTNGIKVRGRYFFKDCSEDPNNWINELYCNYYGINSVKVIQKNK